MKSLVTGAYGFVGRYLCKHLKSFGDSVVGTHIEPQAPFAEIEGRQLDITQYNQCIKVLEEVKPDVIYHLAGLAFAPDAEENFEKALKINVLGTHNVVRAAHILGLKCRFLFISSSEVYGKILPEDLPISEKTPVRPFNNYSLSKLMAEEVVRRYERLGNISAVIVRPFNHIGPGQSPQFVEQIAKITEPGTAVKVGNLDAKRDFSDVRDIVRAYRMAAHKGEGIYNLGSGKSVSINEILDTLIKISEKKITIETDPLRMRASEVPDLFCDYSKAEKEFGWKPEVSLEESLEGVYKSF